MDMEYIASKRAVSLRVRFPACKIELYAYLGRILSFRRLVPGMGTDRTLKSWNIGGRESPFRIFFLVCFVAVLSYLAARLGGTLEILPQAEWPFWPANVLVVAILICLPRKSWPLVFATALGSFIVYNLQAGVTIQSIIWFSFSDIVEILTAALCLSYCFDGLPKLDNMLALAKYSLFAGILAPTVGAFFGALPARGDYWTSWRISFFSESIAYFTILPALLGWISQARSRVRATRVYYLEAIGLFLVTIVLSYLVFVSRLASTLPALAYLLVPFLLWSALRFGNAGAGTSASLVAFFAVWGAAHGRGPFTQAAPIDSVLWLQLFLLSTAVPFMVLAVLVEEHMRDAEELRESEKRFRLVADTAPVLIWMSGTDKMFSFFNKGWLNFTGRSIEQERGEGWVSGVHPADVLRCTEVYSKSFDARAGFEMEYRLRRFDGTYRWIVDYGVPRFDASDNFCGYIGSGVDVTERRSASEALQALTGRLIHAQEQERARIARELHDDFSQRMALLGIGLGKLSKSLSDSELEERKHIAEMLKGVKEISSDLHSLSHQLHSSKLEHVGLASAIKGLCEEMSEKYDIRISFSDSACPRDVPKDVALCFFRVTQEAMGNVVKHSSSPTAEVELIGSSNAVTLRIADAGKGFDPERVSAASGIGLVGMRERIRLVKGQLSVKSEIEHGTEIVAVVPYHTANESETLFKIDAV
jgi:PAS domain S-box-containing protein